MDNNLENQNNVQPVEPVVSTEPEVQTPVQPEVQTPAEPVMETPATPVVEAPVQPEVQTPVEPMMQPAFEAPIQQPTVQPIEQPKKKNVLPLILIIVVLLLAGVGAAVYFLFFNKVTGKQVIDGTIDRVMLKASKSMDKVMDYVVIDYKNDIVENKGDLTLNAEIKAQGATVSYKDIKIGYDTKLNLKNLEGSFKLNTSQEEKEIVNLEAFLKDKVLYANSNLFATPYKEDLSSLDWKQMEDYIKELPEYDESLHTAFFDKLRLYLRNAIKDDYITQTEGNYTIEGVSFKGLKNTLELDAEKRKAIYIDVLTSMKNDEQFINIIKHYTGKTSEQIIDEIEDEIDSINKSTNDVTTTISVYTSNKGDFLALEVVSAKSTLTAVSENKVTTFRVKEDGKETYKFTYDETEKEFTFDIEGGYVFKVKFIDNGIKFSVSGEGVEVDLSLTSENVDKTVKTGLESNLKYDAQGTNVSASIKYTNELKKADKIDTFSATGAKNFEEMTPEEQQAIFAKLEEVAKGTYLEMLLTTTSQLTTVQPTTEPTVYSLDY